MPRTCFYALAAVGLLACGGNESPADSDPVTSSSGQGATVGGAGGAAAAQGNGGAASSSTSVGAGGDGGSGGAPCIGEDDATLCADAGAACGSIDVVDSCGASRQPDCGICSAPDSCGGASIPNQCGCTPKTTAQLCSESSYSCGALSTTDGCGQSLTVDCGGCSGYLSCSSGQCGCSAPPDPTSLTCVDAGGPKLNLYAPSGEIALAYVASGNPTPSACTLQNSSLFQVTSSGISLPWPINTNSCGIYRVCSWDPVCGNAYSTGKVFSICLNSVGQPSCSFQ